MSDAHQTFLEALSGRAKSLDRSVVYRCCSAFFKCTNGKADIENQMSAFRCTTEQVEPQAVGPLSANSGHSKTGHKELSNRLLIHKQTFNEALDADKLERSGR